MDKEKQRKIIARIHLEEIIKNTKTLEDIEESKKYIKFYKKRGYPVKEFEERQEYRKALILSMNYN